MMRARAHNFDQKCGFFIREKDVRGGEPRAWPVRRPWPIPSVMLEPAPPSSPSARARNRHFRRLSALRAHTKAPYKNGFS
jgi:hypothetical protein